MKAGTRAWACVWALVALLGTGLAWAQDGHGSIAGWGEQVVGVDLSAGFAAIAAGGQHSLALKPDGSIVAWGYNAYGLCSVPGPNMDFAAIGAGGYHSIGLKADGSIRTWGDNNYGQCNLPSPNRDFRAVAAGYQHSLGLKADGSIVAWGNNDYGQCSLPEPNAGFVAIAAGGYHSVGLRGYPRGDLNCDRRVNFGDINPFVLALTDPNAYQQVFSTCDIMNGDINGDGVVNFGDINPFVGLLVGR